MRIPRLLTLSFVLTAALTGCATPTVQGPRPVHYTENAKRAYDKAMLAFNNHDWEQAKALFKEVRRKYGYTRYARIAELRIADADFESEKLAESVQGYRSFVHDHRTDPEVPYARFRIAKALFDQVSDSFLLPPQEERDQATTADAYRELSTFLREFPRSRYDQQAQYMMKVVLGRLVRHELYVARYYLGQDRFEAAADRIQYGLHTYSGSGLEPEELVLLGETYLKLHKPADARAAFLDVRAKYPDSPFSTTAQNFLLELDRDRK